MRETPDAPARAGKTTVTVARCPYCGKPHEHPALQTGLREAPCGRGRYRVIVCLGGEKAAKEPKAPPAAQRRGKKSSGA